MTHESDNQALRDLMTEVLSRKRSINARYSLRAFARDTGLQAPELSEFLKGKRILSGKKVVALARKPIFSDPERSQIRLLAGGRVTPSPLPRTELSLEEFRMIADWVHFAIFSMLECDPKIPSSPNRIAKRLGVSVDRIEGAIKRLVELGHLQKLPTGNWEKDRPVLFVRSQGASQALREFNLAMLERSREAAATVPADERHAASVTLCASPEQLPLARKLIDAFAKTFNETLSDASNIKSEVFHLGIHYFSLEKGKSK